MSLHIRLARSSGNLRSSRSVRQIFYYLLTEFAETADRFSAITNDNGSVSNTVIEAAQPLSPTNPEGLDMERAGEGIYSVTFKTKDLKRAAEHLRS